MGEYEVVWSGKGPLPGAEEKGWEQPRRAEMYVEEARYDTPTDTYTQRRARGLCAQCGAVKSQTYRCPDCSRKQAQAVDAKRARLREERRAQGLCVRCAAPSETYRCAICKHKKTKDIHDGQETREA